MVLASSDEGGMVLDPFVGSGTTLRVCQQLNRDCIGIEVNPDYVKMSQERLQLPFDGFDSVDPRMERVPRDLNDDAIRKEYLENHKLWFLTHHENSLGRFETTVRQMYGKRNDKKKQLSFWEDQSE